MQTNALVTKRFAELEAKSREIESKKTKGEVGYHVDSAAIKGWGTSVLNLLGNAFGRDGDHYKEFQKHLSKFMGYDYEYDYLVGIFLAAKEDYEGGYLFRMTSLIKAEVFEDTLEQAEALASATYKDAACVVNGVALELALKELCTKNEIEHGKADRMNTDLCKKGVYNLAKQKQITAWLDLRNKAAHGDWGAYNAQDVKLMLEGVRAFVGDFLS